MRNYFQFNKKVPPLPSLYLQSRRQEMKEGRQDWEDRNRNKGGRNVSREEKEEAFPSLKDIGLAWNAPSSVRTVTTLDAHGGTQGMLREAETAASR